MHLSSVFRPTEVREAHLSNRYIQEKASKKEKFTLVKWNGGQMFASLILSYPIRCQSPNGSRVLNKLSRALEDSIALNHHFVSDENCDVQGRDVLSCCKIFSSYPIKPPSLSDYGCRLEAGNLKFIIWSEW
jgi:hypothetical protein